MNGDRMVIRRVTPLKDIVVDESNLVRDKDACKSYKRYKGLKKPKCNCMPCWALWAIAGRASTEK